MKTKQIVLITLTALMLVTTQSQSGKIAALKTERQIIVDSITYYQNNVKINQHLMLKQIKPTK